MWILFLLLTRSVAFGAIIYDISGKEGQTSGEKEILSLSFLIFLFSVVVKDIFAV